MASIPTEINQPENCQLNEQLEDLVDWEQFALHLPNIRQSHIAAIKRDESSTAGQKQALFDRWLRVCPKASWVNVVQALEKVGEMRIASKLKDEFFHHSHVVQMSPSLSPAPEQQEIEEIQVKNYEHVVQKLDELHNSFVSLTRDVKNEIETKVESGNMTVKSLVQHTEEQKAFHIKDLHLAETTNDFFQTILHHYNFLNCHLIVNLSKLLSDPIEQRANVHSDDVKRFMKNTKIKYLHKTLDRFFKTINPVHACRTIVRIKLEDVYGRHNMWLVEVLVQTLFSLEHSDECQWFQVKPGSIIITFLAPKHMMMLYIVNSVKKIQFMRLVGVISLQVGRIYSMSRMENGQFSFEDSLIEATLENNIEALQFLLEHIGVNVNVQRSLPTISSPESPYKTKSKVTLELIQFVSLFESLIRDAEYELQTATDTTQINIEKLPKNINPSDLNKAADIISAVETSNNFLDYQIISNLKPFLSNSLSQRITQYSTRIESFKRSTKISHLHEQLELYFKMEPPNATRTTVLLESAWSSCSMTDVEQLLQLIFSPSNLNDFKWCRVITGSVGVVFLIPAHLQFKFIVNSSKKLQLMKLTGIISLQVGETKIFQTSKAYNYSFAKGIAEAKKLGNSEALTLLLQVNKSSIANVGNVAIDENNNFHHFPEPDSTPLMIACCNSNKKLVKLLLDNNADPNIQTSRKFTALIYASGSPEIFTLLLHHGADVNVVDFFTYTILHWACILGNIEILPLLLTLSPELLEKQRNNGETPLFIASTRGDVKIVKKLLQAHANPNVPDIDGRTPLYTASDRGYTLIVKCLLWANADPNRPDDYGFTPLHVASINGHLQVIKQLLKANAYPNLQTKQGITPLHFAAEKGHVEIIKHLLAVQTDEFLHTFYYKGNTPLHAASRNGHVQIVECLLQAKADPNSKDESGITPLFAASYNGHIQVVQCLLQAKADPNSKDENGTSPLFAASYNGHIQVVECLLQAKADPNCKDKNGGTPLILASQNGQVNIVKHLLRAKADPNSKHINGLTPLFAASLGGHVQVVECLLLAEADPNIPSLNKTTPLLAASDRGYTQIVEKLLQARADPNIKDKDEETPLHLAGYNGYLHIVKLLLQAQADPTVKAKNGFTPLDAALCNNHAEVAALIRQAQSNYNSSCSTQ